MARGDAGWDSDCDLLAICQRHRRRERRQFEGLHLDLFVERDASLQAPIGADMLRLLGGRVLYDAHGAGRRLLARVRSLERRGPEPLLPGEANANRRWAWRMLDRARAGGLYGDYRRAELLTVLLSTQFELEGRFFPGPKRALAELPAKLSKAWKKALRPGAPLRDVETLVRAAVGGPTGSP